MYKCIFFQNTLLYQNKCMPIVNCVLLYVLMKFWCKLPEDGEICSSLVIETTHRL